MPNNLSSWIWWLFSSVVLAVILNLVSDYLKQKVDIVFGNYKENQRKQSDIQKDRVNWMVEQMRSDPLTVQFIYYRHTITSVLLYIIFSMIIILLFGAFLNIYYLLGFLNSTDANNIKIEGFYALIAYIKTDPRLLLSLLITIVLGVLLIISAYLEEYYRTYKVFYDKVIYKYRREMYDEKFPSENVHP